MAEERPRYTPEEVREIFRRAAARTEAPDGLVHADLVAAAHEAGIDVGEVERAAGELALERQEGRWVAAWDGRRKRRLVSHFLTWLVTGGGLVLLDWLTQGGLWSIWPVGLWAIALALHAISALRAPTPEQVERVSRKERRKLAAEERRRERKRAQEALRLRLREAAQGKTSGAREFERVVEAGVSALLAAVARQLEPPGPRPDTEFNRYVARKERPAGARAPAAPAKEPIVTPPPRVRVEVDEEPEPDPGAERAARRERR